MKTKDIRKLKPEEMNKRLKELNTELIKLAGESATGTPPKSPGQIRQVKRTIAKIKTMQREKEIENLKNKPTEAQ